MALRCVTKRIGYVGARVVPDMKSPDPGPGVIQGWQSRSVRPLRAVLQKFGQVISREGVVNYLRGACRAKA